jgi:DNA-binding transcriptional regulator YdaS (Cro superfamily)
MDESERDMDPLEREKAHKAFRRAVALSGSPGIQTTFARMVGTSSQYISRLLKNRRLLPKQFVHAAEAGTGVPKEELRPDLYPTESETQSPGARPSEAPAASSPDEAAGVRRPSDPLEGLRS